MPSQSSNHNFRDNHFSNGKDFPPPPYNDSYDQPSAPGWNSQYQNWADELVDEKLKPALIEVNQARQGNRFSTTNPNFEAWQNKTEGNNIVVTLTSSQSLHLLYHFDLLDSDAQFKDVLKKTLIDRCSVM